MLCDFVYSHSHICLIYIALVNNTDGNTNFGLMPYEFVINYELCIRYQYLIMEYIHDYLCVCCT